MIPDGAGSWAFESSLRSGLFYVLLLGLYLTLRGYHSFDGDQAYRLPLLLHRQDPSLYAEDPFVRSFDQFNPASRAGYSYKVIDHILPAIGGDGSVEQAHMGEIKGGIWKREPLENIP